MSFRTRSYKLDSKVVVEVDDGWAQRDFDSGRVRGMPLFL